MTGRLSECLAIFSGYSGGLVVEKNNFQIFGIFSRRDLFFLRRQDPQDLKIFRVYALVGTGTSPGRQNRENPHFEESKNAKNIAIF